MVAFSECEMSLFRLAHSWIIVNSPCNHNEMVALKSTFFLGPFISVVFISLLLLPVIHTSRKMVWRFKPLYAHKHTLIHTHRSTIWIRIQNLPNVSHIYCPLQATYYICVSVSVTIPIYFVHRILLFAVSNKWLWQLSSVISHRCEITTSSFQIMSVTEEQMC